MTDTADTREDVDRHRLELLRRRLTEQGLRSTREVAHASVTTELSDGQRRMWFVQMADPTGVILNICLSYQITGQLDATRLRNAVNAVASRHRMLRTTYHADVNGEPRLTVHDDLTPGWSEHDLSGLSDPARRLRLEVLAQREFNTPFNLTTDAPLRISLIRTEAQEHLLLLVAHHIAWDDGCWPVFFNDLTRAYLGERLVPSESAQVAAVDHEGADLEYWRSVLADLPEPLELPGPNGSTVPTNWRSQRTTLTLSSETMARVATVAKDCGATPYIVLLAAFGALIHRYTHSDDFLVASPVLNRSVGSEDAIGYHGNTVALRLRPRARQTFREAILQARDTAVGAFAHQRTNLDRVVRELNPDRRNGVDRLTRVAFGVRGSDGEGFSPPGIVCRRAELRGQYTQLPLAFMLELDGAEGAAVVEAEFLVEVLDRALAHQMLEHFAVILGDALENPDRPVGELTIMNAVDAEWLHKTTLGERFSTPATTLVALIEDQVARTPEHVAVVHEGRSYTFREINESANRVAHWLIAQGVGTEDRVAVLLDRSPELVITALAVIKAGAVYLPVDPADPGARIDFILSDSGPKMVIRKEVGALGGVRVDNPSDDDRVRPLRPDNAAYLIYTSGSTGLPKGVSVPHQPIAEYFVWFKGEYAIDHRERLLQVASPSFDVSIGEIFGMLACGGRLVVPRSERLRDVGYLTELLHDEGITSMHLVPSLLGLLLSLPGVNQWRGLQRIPIGGEALPGELADRFHATFDSLLHNFYGPTETVLNASRYRVEGKQGHRTVPIGTPKINTQIHLLDDALQPVPVGVVGEIYIGGSHVARGYHDRPGLTAERFVADPFNPGGRLYRSGDLARRNADGDIEFVGRADDQVKIRGFRIECGEVAAAISVDPSVGQAVVVARDLPGTGRSLVAYLTPANGAAAQVDVGRIKARVAAALPAYMTPAFYVVLDEIPITNRGKIDRAALPAPSHNESVTFRPPAAGTERRVANLFAELLQRNGIRANDSFFELGGHSLLATRFVAAVRNLFNVDIGVRDVFELGTVASLAERIDSATSDCPVRPRLVAAPHDGPQPLSASQSRMWFHHRLNGPDAVNNIPFAARITGPCDVEAFVAAVRDIVARHEVLRTTYCEIDGVPHQIVNDADTVAVRRAHGDDREWLNAELARERGGAFDLDRETPLRAAVLSTPAEHVVSLVVHHIAADHWSAPVVFSELVAAYRARRAGRAPRLAPLHIQYADFAAWQTAHLADTDGIVAAQRDYWRDQLAELPQTGLSPDLARPPVLTDAADYVEFTVAEATRGTLTELSRQLGITDFMLLQTAVAVALHKAGDGFDIPLLAPVAGRTETELDQLIGSFGNLVVLRNDLRDNPTVREMLRRTRETALAAYAHSDLPFDHVANVVGPVPTSPRDPLFGVVVHMWDALPKNQLVESGVDGVTMLSALEPPIEGTHADLAVLFSAADNGFRGQVIYRTDLYRRATVQRFADWLNRVLQAFADDPGQRLRDVQIADREERRAVWELSVANGVSVLDRWRDPVAINAVGDVYDHVPDEHGGTRLRPSDKRARWTTAGQLEYVVATRSVGGLSRHDAQRDGVL
ncbi:non-ribosomal peptide synthetase [Mycobacterium deserti]|uniref:non-ribosomal peptide synthetase n=1 Tax=Mycobacterium deserti TaxID=2978347 RepID=UPI0028D553DB|nr:non-ribosomal peptide synthetase [Mycobacterium deserti]